MSTVSKKGSSDIFNVYLHPSASSKSISSSAFTSSPFLMDFVSNSFVLYKDIQRRFVTSRTAKATKCTI